MDRLDTVQSLQDQIKHEQLKADLCSSQKARAFHHNMVRLYRERLRTLQKADR